MSLTISSENQYLLSELVASGKYPSEEEALAAAISVLRDTPSSARSSEGEILAPDEWIKEFDRITQSRTGGNAYMDDSRESLYGDRGL